jgi:putative endonuclease
MTASPVITCSPVAENGSAPHNRTVGAVGEGVVCEWYEENGYTIVARNWRHGRLGEIDIVAMRGRVLVFCEVKTRTSARFGSGLEAITEVKARRMRLLGTAFRTTQNIAPSVRSRFDVAAITGNDFRLIEDAV